MHKERTMGKHKLAVVAFDSAKEKHAVAIADDGRDGEVRHLGETGNGHKSRTMADAKFAVLSMVAGSGPRPCANARFSALRPWSKPGRP
jgi:hypothetical protein